MTRFRHELSIYPSPEHAIDAPAVGIDAHECGGAQPTYLTPRNSPIDTLVAL